MDQPPPSSKEPRGPVSLRIKFRSASLDQFIERYAVDVSRGGIFIRTREPLPVGTQLRFNFQLQDAAPLLAGEGTIVWIRENDPSRAGVTPGMGVRFDKLTPASQPVLEKILAEKARREQAGAPAKTGPAGGMAVRRPSSTFSALDPAAARAAQAAGGPPRVGGLSPLSAQPRATGSGAMATGAQPRTTQPAISSDPFGTGAQPRANAPATGSGPVGSNTRTAENPVPAGIPTLESSGAFGRPRSTMGMNAQRPAPAPSALFEKPTADDIDRALSVLTEIDGPAPAPIAVPVDFSSRIRRPTDAHPAVLESSPDVGDVPKATPRHQTDAQPMVLESAPDVGDAPSRRSGTRPLFSGTNEMKVPTVPVIPIADSIPAAARRDEALHDEHDEEEEDDATSAWVGSGPTRVGGSGTEPDMPAAAQAGGATAGSPSSSEIPKAAAPPAFSRDAPAPRAAAPAFAAAASQKKKRGSGATFAIIILVLVGAGGGYYFLEGPGRNTVSGTAPAPAATTAPEGTTPAAAPEGTAPAAQNTAAPDASAVAAPSAPAEPEKAAAEKPATGGTATPSTLRLRPAGEAPNEAAAKPAEAKPAAAEAKHAEAKHAEAKPAGHKGKRRGGGAAAAEASAEAASAEAASAVADVSPTANGDATAPPPGDAPAKAAGGGHVLKISSSPAGAEVIVDGSSVGTTPYSGGEVDPALPHSITLKKDGFESYEHMIGGSDWPRSRNGVRTLKLNAKLRSTGGGESGKPTESDKPVEPPPGLGTTPASPKRE
jgi:uncharacterized protein (TIGR02266 family)